MRALVTGGGGFLGGAIVRKLLDQGYEVRSYSRGEYPLLTKLGVEAYQGDITDREQLARAAEGCGILFHTAANAGVWGPYSDYERTNVTGTRNVIDVCRAKGVTRLVYTSTPSVAFAGHDQEGLDESTPYPTHYLAHYPKTKAEAERAVLEANDESLQTVALRPHLIWGPGDTQLIPRIIERAKTGRLRIVGKGDTRVDAVYIDNAAHAHCLAGERLDPGAPCAGKAYYITNHEPIAMAELLNRILEAAQLPPLNKHISPQFAYAAGAILEGVYRVMRKKEEPPMTRFVARQLATAHWYDNTAAIHDLHYYPTVTMEEGFQKLADSLRE